MAATRADYVADLRAIPPADWRAYLSTYSNLPGPRGNLTLLDAAADVLPRDMACEFRQSDDEYLACCGVATLGRLALDDPADHEVVDLLARSAVDGRWRVREAAAIAGQRIGDSDPARLRELVGTWSRSREPLLVRCAVASVCEPRLLTDRSMVDAALEACRLGTDLVASTPAAERRHDAVRTLRQGLGYCWSVAVAADPDRGLAAFLALDIDDADIAWIVRENRKKKRLARLLPA